MSDAEEILNEATVVVVKPGDRLLLVVRHPYTLQDVDVARHRLRATFPDVEFAFVCATHVVHQPAEPVEPRDRTRAVEHD